jgi:mitochondrial intermediate peptidase
LFARGRCDAIIQRVAEETSPTVDTLRRLDLISDTICQVVDAAEACRNMHSDEEWREAANAVVYHLSEYIAHLNVDRRLYAALLRVMHSPAAGQFTEEQRRMCESLKEEFERDGMHLSGADRDTAVKLVGEMNDACMQFVGNIHKEPGTFTVSPASFLKDLPPGYMTLVPNQPHGVTAEGPVTLSCHPTMLYGILRYAKNPKVRKAALQASLSQHADNVPVLARLVAVRDKIAKRAGCTSYSQYILRHRMAGSPEVRSACLFFTVG